MAQSVEQSARKVSERISVAGLPLERAAMDCGIACFDAHGTDVNAIQQCTDKCYQPLREFHQKANLRAAKINDALQACLDVCTRGREKEKPAAAVCADKCFVEACAAMKHFESDVKLRKL